MSNPDCFRDAFVTKWHDSRPRPSFETPVYFYGYDGTNYAYQQNGGGVWHFLFFVVGIILDETALDIGADETDDLFLDRVGVSYGFWEVTR